MQCFASTICVRLYRDALDELFHNVALNRGCLHEIWIAVDRMTYACEPIDRVVDPVRKGRESKQKNMRNEINEYIHANDDYQTPAQYSSIGGLEV